MTREDIISVLRGLIASYQLNAREWQAVDMAIEALKEPKQGEWIIRGDNTFITCNKCGHVKGVNCIYFRTHFEPLPNFCEMCGARMKEGDEK